MGSHYVYKKLVKRSRYKTFRRYLALAVVVLILAGGVGYYIYSSLRAPQPGSPVSAAETTVISGNKTTFTNQYFQFEDTGTWVLDKHSSVDGKQVYHRFRKNILEHELIVYINRVPIPLLLEVPRALPVRMVNDDSFQVTNISSPCVSQYAKGELHKVKEVTINGAAMLCDPDSPQYSVVISEIGGDYRLHLKRPDGTPIQFVIIYKDNGLDPQPDSLVNVASSFKTR